ncbi:MAG: 50S ribosomal protein L10 [Thermoanaerobaculaceae bacterium]|nr:50S ribosomal protein L10 [Thermoanaerobaculaceae bacterium]TAM51422.1 MAG: 50S ribosomal protein L10 [Acidobacteriota bacterium]
MLTRAQKQEQIETLRATLAPASGLFVMDFTGLTVGEVTELRRKVREANGSYQVVKNTLAKLSIAETPHQSLQQLLSGPAALAFTSNDAVILAKALADFAKAHDKLKFRGGLVEGQLLDAVQAKQVATLPSKKELVARLLFLLQSPMRRLVTVLDAPVRGLAVSLQQIADKKGTPDEGVTEQAKEN